MKRFLIVFISSFLIFTLVFTGVIIHTLKDDANNGIVKDIAKRIIEDKEKKKKVKNEITFLLLGVDTDDLKKGDYQRTDTIMLVNYDTLSGNISILSIPRDTRAIIRGRARPEKINHAHAYGGPELTVKAVKDLVGIEADYYVKVDYKVVKEFVDIIDGVEIDVPMRMVYRDPTANPPLNINLQKGLQVLDGDKALQYLRFRKGYINQDIGRIEAQQQFIKATVKETLKPMNVFKLPQMIKTLYKHVDTDVPIDVVISYIPKVTNINLDTITMATVPGDSKLINGLWYYVPDEKQTDELVKEMFLNHSVAKGQ